MALNDSALHALHTPGPVQTVIRPPVAVSDVKPCCRLCTRTMASSHAVEELDMVLQLYSCTTSEGRPVQPGCQTSLARATGTKPLSACTWGCGLIDPWCSGPAKTLHYDVLCFVAGERRAISWPLG